MTFYRSKFFMAAKNHYFTLQLLYKNESIQYSLVFWLNLNSIITTNPFLQIAL